MSKCIHANKLHDNLWCSTACMYCTLSQEEMCRHRKDIPDTKDAKTNADHIRSMTDEELAEWLFKFFWGRKSVALLDMAGWLKQHYKEDA